jgi:antitoxin CptB
MDELYTPAQDASLKRLRWRCRRGTRELDRMLGGFLESRFRGLKLDQQYAFERLLECEDDVLWDWLSGHSKPQDGALNEVVEAIRAGDYA